PSACGPSTLPPLRALEPLDRSQSYMDLGAALGSVGRGRWTRLGGQARGGERSDEDSAGLLGDPDHLAIALDVERDQARAIGLVERRGLAGLAVHLGHQSGQVL